MKICWYKRKKIDKNYQNREKSVKRKICWNFLVMSKVFRDFDKNHIIEKDWKDRNPNRSWIDNSCDRNDDESKFEIRFHGSGRCIG